jgi:hypothetical protein
MVSIGWVTTIINPALGDSIAGSVGDWIRLTPMTWIIWTENSTMEVAQAFKSKLKAQDIVVVMYLDAKGAAGIAPQWVWNWLNSKIFCQKSG